MPLILAANGNISTAPTDTGSYTWAEVVALGSSRLTAYADGSYRWTGTIDIQGGLLAIEDAEINLHGISGTQPGIIRALANGIVRFGRKSTIGGKTCYTNGCSIRITNEVSLSATEEAPLSYCYDDSSETIARLEIFASRIVLDSDFRSNIFVSEAAASLLSKTNRGTFYTYIQPNGGLIDCTADRTNLELLGDSAFAGNRSYAAPFGLTLYTNSSRRLVVRDFSPAGATRDYQLDWLDAFTFLNCPDVVLANGRVGANSRTIAVDSYKAFEHVLKIVDAAGNPIEGAQINYSGFQSLTRTTDANGLHAPFGLIVERTDLIGQVGLRNGFLDTIDTSTYSREIKSYRHLEMAAPIAVSSELGSSDQPFPVALTADSGITQISPTTAAGYSEFSNTATLATITANTTLDRLYDNRAAYWRSNVGQNKPIRSGTFAQIPVDLKLNSGVVLTPTTKHTGLSIAAGRSITFAQAANYSALPLQTQATSIIHFEAGGTATIVGTFAAGTQITVADGQTVTVNVPSNQLSNLVAGTGVALSAPPFRIFGLPTVPGANPVLRVKRVSTGTIVNPTVTNGEAFIQLAGGEDYEFRADARGYVASRFITINTANQSSLQITLDRVVDADGNPVYEQGNSTIASLIAFDLQNFRVTIAYSAANPTIDVASAFRAIEDYLASPIGLELTAHPLYDNGAIVLPRDSITNAINPLRIQAHAANTGVPELQFVVRLAGGDVYGAYDLSSKALKFPTTLNLAQVQGGGGGLTAAQDAALMRIDGKTSAIAVTSGKVEASIDATLLAKEATVNAVGNAVLTRATPADVVITVSGGFTGTDRTKLNSINPPAAADIRTAIEATTVLAKVADLPPAPDNTSIAAILAKVNPLTFANGQVAATVNLSSVATSNAVAAVATQVSELYRMRGLDPANPWLITDTSESSGAISLTRSDNGTTTTVQRQP